MKEHPTAGEFEVFLQGMAPLETAKLVVRHLLAACSTCRSTLEEIGWGRTRLERLVTLITSDPEELPAPEHDEGYGYDRTFENAWQASVTALGSLQPHRLQEEMADDADGHILPADELPPQVEDRVPEPRLIELLLDRSHKARYDDPAKMLTWARLAQNLVERCDPVAAGGATLLADLKTRAWSQLGTALRVNGRLHEAERCLAVAERHIVEGTGKIDLKIDLLERKASLATYQRRFQVALDLLDQAERLCVEFDQRAQLPLCLICKAIARVYSGEPELAIQLLDRAIPLIDPASPRLLLSAYHNLIHCYVEAGRLQEALALFPQTKSLGEELKDDFLKCRMLWQEGKILSELGLLEEAEAQFSRARQGFTERDIGYEAALVSLDLTAVYVKLGLHAEVRRTIADILPIFSSLRVGRELLASLIQLQQAEDQTQALQLIRALSRELVAGPKLPPSV